MDAATLGTHAHRAKALAVASATDTIDVLIVGAGINGCGTFWDLSLNGVQCLLVDGEDFGAGASSASTRIAHGGLRYLENGEIRLVAEATIERNRLLQNASHYVTPLLITIPSFSRFGGIFGSIGKLVGVRRPMRSRGLALIKVGLIVYDCLGRRQRSLPRHKMSSARGAASLLPQLHPGIAGIASYYDARITHTERLAFELVSDGLHDNPAALAINHCKFVGMDAGMVVLHDTIGDTTFTIRPKVMINAAGAWIDTVNGHLGRNERLIGGTKGSHILIDNPALFNAMAARGFSYDDGTGRMCVAYPMGSLIMLGSSDIRISNADDAICDDDEVAYFLATIRLIFPMITVERSQIRYRFSGVRPLPVATGTNTVDISRDHSIHEQPAQGDRSFPVLSLIGGKWTTFRAFAEQASDHVLKLLGRSRTLSTRDLAIGGGRGYPVGDAARQHWLAEARTSSQLELDRLEVLLTRYGSTAAAVMEFCIEGIDKPLVSAPTYTDREVRYLIRHEMACTIDDLIYRRTLMAMEGLASAPLLSELADILVDEHSGRLDQASEDQATRAAAIDALIQAATTKLMLNNAEEFQAATRRMRRIEPVA